MSNVEKSVKQQFAKVFKPSDWRLFKHVADVYLRQAAFLRKRDVRASSQLKLLVRNAQKRLLIGVGIELLLKALYLRNGYAINRVEQKNKMLKFPFGLDEVKGLQVLDGETFQLASLIDQISKVIHLSDGEAALNGLKIAKVFRNKEGHVITSHHAFDASNYRDIEFALRKLYREGFSESLDVRFSLGPNEQPVWKVRRNRSLG